MTSIFELDLEKEKNLYPIGTVVKVGFIEQAIMIYGRKQTQNDVDDVWDYVGCPYPQGHLSNETNVFFNHDQIESIIFKGLVTKGEIILRDKLESVKKKED